MSMREGRLWDDPRGIFENEWIGANANDDTTICISTGPDDEDKNYDEYTVYIPIKEARAFGEWLIKMTKEMKETKL